MILLGRESAEQKVVTQFGTYDARKVCIELKKAADSHSVLLMISPLSQDNGELDFSKNR